MKSVQAGELNRRITIFREAETTDADGYGTAERRTVRSCWAKVTKVSGTELVKANADFGQEKVRFLIRYPGAGVIDRKMLVHYEDRDYEIEYLNDYGGRQYLEIWGTWQSREAS